MTDRELLQQALDTLEHLQKDVEWQYKSPTRAMLSKVEKALRVRLKQPENEFAPDWDAMAVMVEEQQRMAKRIEELEAALAQPEQEPVRLQCVTCGTVYADGVPPQIAQLERKLWLWKNFADGRPEYWAFDNP